MPNKTPNDGSLQTTKQMLDELDALMDRMLSLPVNELDDSPALPVESPVLSAKLTLLDSPLRRPSAPALEKPMPAVSYQTLAPAREEPVSQAPPLAGPHFAPPSIEPDAPTYTAVPPEPFTNDVEPPSVLPQLEPMLAEITDSEAPATTRYGYLPLLWLNQQFDGLTMMMPGVGAGLRTETGRTMLGLCGIVLTLAAAIWLLKDWLGWN